MQRRNPLGADWRGTMLRARERVPIPFPTTADEVVE